MGWAEKPWIFKVSVLFNNHGASKKLPKVDMVMELRLHSPCGGEPAIYQWPLTTSVKKIMNVYILIVCLH